MGESEREKRRCLWAMRARVKTHTHMHVHSSSLFRAHIKSYTIVGRGTAIVTHCLIDVLSDDAHINRLHSNGIETCACARARSSNCISRFVCMCLQNSCREWITTESSEMNFASCKSDFRKSVFRLKALITNHNNHNHNNSRNNNNNHIMQIRNMIISEENMIGKSILYSACTSIHLHRRATSVIWINFCVSRWDDDVSEPLSQRLETEHDLLSSPCPSAHLALNMF